MALNKNSLKAAVKRIKPLLQEGQTEQEVKGLIKADEKGFSDEDVNEIYPALYETDESEKSYSYTVENYFRDVNDFSIEYKEGDDVSHFAPERLEYCINIGLVKKEEK